MTAYLTPQEFLELMNSNTTGALEYVIHLLYIKYLEMVNLQLEINAEMDDDVIGGLEYEMKAKRREETSLHRLESGIQSRLKAG